MYEARKPLVHAAYPKMNMSKMQGLPGQPGNPGPPGPSGRKGLPGINVRCELKITIITEHSSMCF